MFDSRWLTRATGCQKDLAYRHADWLVKSAERWGIDTPQRIAAWVAQLAHESRLFTQFFEELNYTTPARLISVWPTRFRLPVSEGEAQAERFLDGKRNPRRYVDSPEQLAEFVYGGRMGNGPEGSGDGWRFIGRGFIHLTGRANYRRYSQASGHNVEVAPDMLIYPLYAADSAGWFWQAHDCNALADAGDWHGLTRRINGGLNGIADRLRLTRMALDASGLA